MAISDIEFTLIQDLFARADKKQQSAFVKWMSAKSPKEKPPELASVEDHLASKGVIPICPRCGNTHLRKNGKHNGRQRYLCMKCGKTTGLSRNSLLFGTKKPFVTWDAFLYSIAMKHSLRESARVCSISLPTACAWRQKIQKALVNVAKPVLAEQYKDILGSEEELDRALEEEIRKLFRGKRTRRPVYPGTTNPTINWYTKAMWRAEHKSNTQPETPKKALSPVQTGVGKSMLKQGYTEAGEKTEKILLPWQQPSKNEVQDCRNPLVPEWV